MPHIQAPADVTAEWLSHALGGHEITEFHFERVGSGQMSECYRFHLSYSGKSKGPSSVILKVAAQDPSSRHTGASFGLYQREVLFYQEIAPQLTDAVCAVYHASFESEDDTFALLLTDAENKKTGDDIQGATLPQAKACVEALGRIHGRMLREGAQQYAWLERESPLDQSLLQTLFNGFVGRYRDKLTVEHLNLCGRLVGCFDGYKEQQKNVSARGMIHGDFRLDNILFGEDSSDVTILDWQTVTVGSVLGDLAYFLGCALPVDFRRAHMDELVGIYHESLGPNPPFDLERCRQDLRHEAFFGIVMGIGASMIVEQTERGDRMFTTMMARHCDLALDLNSVQILPRPVQLPALQPLPEDEGLHPRGAEVLFNESYYFDVVDAKQGIAAYVRLGITPNVQAGGWYLAIICRRGKPMVSVLDYACPIPDESLSIKTASYQAEHIPVDPLKTFDVKLRGRARVHQNEASVFEGDAGQEGPEVALNLRFQTDGVPYRYRVTTRYEIPCLVDGEVIVSDEKYPIKQQVGQRDHSWGVRNWWNMDWIWTSIHLNDNTHIHFVDLTVKGQGRLGIGYYQKPGLDVRELSEISSEWDIDSNTNLVAGSTVQFTPHGLESISARIEAIGHGPLRLLSESGEVAYFDRAWCKITLADSRTGFGWVEWNRVQSS